MTNKQQKQRIEQLVEEINKHNHLYYIENAPVISDKEFDALLDELIALEQQTGFVKADSPTKRVGAQISTHFDSHAHKARLYSLDKANNFEDVLAWIERAERRLLQDAREQAPTLEFAVEYKFDGTNINLTYENGLLTKATTRGNGIVGELVTNQVATIKSVPLSINFKGVLEVGCEIVMSFTAFDNYNNWVTIHNETATKITDRKEFLKNTRNAASGAVRNLDPRVTKERNLTLFAYAVNYAAEKDGSQKSFATQCSVIKFLQENNLNTHPYLFVTSDVQKLKTELEAQATKKDQLDYLTDGLVIKLNDRSLYESLGHTEKFPRFAIAYKFEAEEVTTTLYKVTWQVGRTGKLTPLAHLDPVDVSGVTVKQATLNNYNDIVRKGVKLNSRVMIRRSNDVIPEILYATEHYDSSVEITKPANCPSCKANLIEDGANLFCTNKENCLDQIVFKLSHFASKNAFDIEGLSEKTIRQILPVLEKPTFADLFLLNQNPEDTISKLKNLDGLGKKKIEKLLQAIEKSKEIELARFIFALGIDDIGQKAAKTLANNFKTLQNIMAATFEDLLELSDFGEVMAKSVTDYFADEKNIFVIDKAKLLGLDVKDVQAKVVDESLPFANKKVCITGTLSNYKRSEAAKLIEQLGGEIVSSVGKTTNILIAGEAAGSKLEK
ncbi:MAG: NAD-dependent DNA ligase LigA, partial [Firmicutes bacterium]|nr:NAD-dependent DNA ligase LigA [Bacillota bacterium]